LNTKEKKFLIFLFLGALVVRIIYLWEMSASPYFGAPFLDELYHLNWARDVAMGRWLRHDAFFRAPLYSYLLGGFIRIFGVDYFFIRLAQHLVGAGAAIAVYFLTRRIFSQREARIAGILAAVYAPFFYFEGEMLDIFLQFLFYPLILIQALRTLETPSLKNGLVLGALLGLSAMARPNILLFAPILFIYLAIKWHRNRDSFGDLLFRLGVILAAMVCLIAPAAIHNYKAGRCFVPIASFGGINFHIGNNPDADGFTASTPQRMYHFGRYQDSVEMFAKAKAQAQLGRTLNAAEVNRFWSERAVHWILNNPLDWAKLMAKKLALFLGNAEIKNNKNIYFVAQYSHILKIFLIFLPFAIIGSLGLVGIYFAMARRGDSGAQLLLLFALTYTAGVVLFFVSDRFRAPIMTALIPAAAYALTAMWDAANEQERGKFIGAMAALFILVGLSLPDWFHVRPANYSRDFWSVGNCRLEKGELDLAEKEYRRAIFLDPNYDDALNNLGETLYKKGEIESAMDVFSELLERHPDYAAGWNNLGACYEKLDKFDMAEKAYRRALVIYEGHITARLNLAETLLKQGKMDEARQEYQIALRDAPDHLRLQIKSDERFEKLQPPSPPDLLFPLTNETSLK